VKKQIKWIDDALAQVKPDAPPFVFLNLAETHVPYWHEGAPWNRGYNPSVPFGNNNDAAEASGAKSHASNTATRRWCRCSSVSPTAR
jgi:hypothetical protein